MKGVERATVSYKEDKKQVKYITIKEDSLWDWLECWTAFTFLMFLEMLCFTSLIYLVWKNLTALSWYMFFVNVLLIIGLAFCLWFVNQLMPEPEVNTK